MKVLLGVEHRSALLILTLCCGGMDFEPVQEQHCRTEWSWGQLILNGR